MYSAARYATAGKGGGFRGQLHVSDQTAETNPAVSPSPAVSANPSSPSLPCIICLCIKPASSGKPEHSEDEDCKQQNSKVEVVISRVHGV